MKSLRVKAVNGMYVQCALLYPLVSVEEDSTGDQCCFLSAEKLTNNILSSATFFSVHAPSQVCDRKDFLHSSIRSEFSSLLGNKLAGEKQ